MNISENPCSSKAYFCWCKLILKPINVLQILSFVSTNEFSCRSIFLKHLLLWAQMSLSDTPCSSNAYFCWHKWISASIHAAQILVFVSASEYRYQSMHGDSGTGSHSCHLKLKGGGAGPGPWDSRKRVGSEGSEGVATFRNFWKSSEV